MAFLGNILANPAKTRPKMAKIRPTIAKMRPQMAKMRLKMAGRVTGTGAFFSRPK